MEEPADESELAAAEQDLGVPLPIAYKQFLKCTKGLGLDGLAIGLHQTFRHPAIIKVFQSDAPAICIADYWLESDGDQVLLEYSKQPSDDPPVFYYAHSAGTDTARELAPSFSEWIESLPKSAVFKR